MSETFFYKVGGLVIRVDSDLSRSIPHDNAEDFVCEPQNPDMTYVLKQTDRINDILSNAAMTNVNAAGIDFTGSDGTYYRAFHYDAGMENTIGFFDVVTAVKGNRGIIYYLDENAFFNRFRRGFNFFTYLYIERLMYARNRLVLHSSHIEDGKHALLFSAPSGTGKSTQAELWKKYDDAIEIINGDRTVIACEKDVWTAYGCPMCGTSGIHLNRSAPLAAIILLAQGKENTITEYSAARKIRFLYSQCAVNRADEENVNAVIDLLSKLVNDIPVLMYSCTKERDAYEYLNSYLKERGMI